jgi:hypothetical protein
MNTSAGVISGSGSFSPAALFLVQTHPGFVEYRSALFALQAAASLNFGEA